jgi:hypothetical protein
MMRLFATSWITPTGATAALAGTSKELRINSPQPEYAARARAPADNLRPAPGIGLRPRVDGWGSVCGLAGFTGTTAVGVFMPVSFS